ncbi:hypothetical protein NJC38_02530 [Pseudomonas sp. 21LCFQ010]|uniref:hypothetical protein n=1 Tax=Pseudomonas sp. 21LCFQ010 TaxID=2957506 RepID=UPI002097E6AF|nr:hypothetical protein [Pseudomonas sp. 21LCFQ010]MCO8161026.1 hypothetical protein [Pseudomonas sp. 21LCFQ010]
MNNDLMLVSRELLKRLYVYAEMPADEFGEIAALLAAPAAQAVDEDSTRIEKALRSIASIPGDSVHYHATHMSRIARAALADPVPTAREAEALAAEKALGIERLPAESVAPVQSEHEPVAVLQVSRLDSGARVADVLWFNAQTLPLDSRIKVFAAPVRAERLPDSEGVADALKRVINAARTINFGPQYAKHVVGDDDPQYLQRHEWVEYLLETCSEAEAQLNAQPAGPES